MKLSNTALRFGLLLTLVLAGCGVKKSDKYNPENAEVAHIYFGKTDVVLDLNDKQALDDLAAAFKKEQSKTKEPLVVVLTAHTSNEGSLASNKKVAVKRADSVANYLRKNHNVEVVVHALDDPRCGEGPASRLVVARIAASSSSAHHASVKNTNAAKKANGTKKAKKVETKKIEATKAVTAPAPTSAPSTLAS